MQINFDELKKVFLTVLELVTDTRCVEIKFGAEIIEIGKCSLHKDLDKQGKYKNAYYIFINGEYVKINNTVNEDFKKWIEFRIKRYIINNGECDIFLNVKNYIKVKIKNLEAINNDEIGEMLRNTKFKGVQTKSIDNEELKHLISQVDYLSYSFPFNFQIGKDFYEVGLGSPFGDIDEEGIFTDYQYLTKNKTVIFFKDPDCITYDEIDKLVEKINKGNKNNIELHISKLFMSGQRYWLGSFSKTILNKIQKITENHQRKSHLNI